ncbi:MarR family transcriptional regulator [Angustibacter aerolatus]
MPRPTARRAALLQRLWVLDQESSLETALFHADAAAAMGLGVTDTKALGILQRDGAQTAGQLAARLAVTSGAVTGDVVRLAARGVARRGTDPADGRRVLVQAVAQPTDAGSPYAAIGAAFSALYARYSEEQIAFLVQHTEDSLALLREARAGLAAP